MTRAAVRESQAAVALIRERHDADWKYLCHWSRSWGAWHFVGGHREPGETFRECAVREACEELGVAADHLRVVAPLARLEYVAHSRSAGVPTAYVIEVYETLLCAARGVELGGRNRWVTGAEVRRGRTDDGTPVSPTVDYILTQLG
jgi:8-oxo-dGTP pyrophosphatase MutT (NUDIX family)